MNLKIKELQNELYRIIAESGLPVGVVYLILKGQTDELERLFADVCSKAMMEDKSNGDES